MTFKTFRKDLKKRFRIWLNTLRVKGKTKYFCIGCNKTGTTSVSHAFRDLGFIVGRQYDAEMLSDRHYFKGEFQPIIDYCRTAQVFQDVPFSKPGTFREVDRAYPGSKFILTIRDSPEQWYRSLTSYHSKKFGQGSLPTAAQLKEAVYRRKGMPYDNLKRMYGTPDDDLYHKETLIAAYQRHNQDVIDYFADRPQDLLVINVAEPGAYARFLSFLGVSSPLQDFPWSNKT